MKYIEIIALENGAHRNINFDGISFAPDNGWAIIPYGMDTPNFPFGSITVDDTQTPPVVTSWTPLPIPESEPEPEPSPTTENRVSALETENKTLKAQLNMQAKKYAFLEDCILEIGDIVYA